jgi:dCTP diphosphatase
MADERTTVAELRAVVRQFVAERDWEPFHTPKNVSMGIAIEAAELMEHFLWLDGPASLEVARQPEKKAAIADEMADVAAYLLRLSDVLEIDLSEALRGKMVKNAIKYPAEKYRGKFEA